MGIVYTIIHYHSALLLARNIGTAFGVAVLSQIYLTHINTTLPPSLSISRAAASQFIISGIGAGRFIVESVIYQGFKLTALACAVLCACAMTAAFFMRTRTRASETVVQLPAHGEERGMPVATER